MKTATLIFVALFSSTLCFGQGGIADVMNTNNMLRRSFSDMRTLANSSLGTNIPWERVAGSPFWQDEWKTASLYDKQNKLAGTMPVRVNLNTSAIHFIDEKREEMCLDPSDVRKVVFQKEGENGKEVIFVSFMPNLYKGEKKVDGYVQVMNQGIASLLKYERKYIITGDSASPGHKRYFYKAERYYYIHYNQKIEYLKKLNRDEVFAFLPGASVFESYITQNKLNMKKEDDIVKFIDYYNANKQ
jgi:hypothetical protein